MSIRIEFVADDVAALVDDLMRMANALRTALAETDEEPVRPRIQLVEDLSRIVVDKQDNRDNIANVAAADLPAPVLETRDAVETLAATTQSEKPREIADMLPVLTSAYRNGDQDMRDKIIALKNSLGLQLLTHAKTDEHRAAYARFIANEGLDA